MNKTDITKSRLLFEIARKKASQNITAENLLVKATSHSAQKCKTARNDFAYERSMTELEIDKVMLDNHQNASAKTLQESLKTVIENKKQNTAVISA